MKVSKATARLALTAGAIVWAGAAAAAERDGSGSASAAPEALRAIVSVNCGATIRSTLRTSNERHVTDETDFTGVPDASVTVTVPSGSTRCIKVEFTAESACGFPSQTDFCYIRAVLNGTPMHPVDDFRAFDSESLTAQARAYEWVRRVGAGTYTVRIEYRVDDTDSEFYLDDWTLDVEQTN